MQETEQLPIKHCSAQAEEAGTLGVAARGQGQGHLLQEGVTVPFTRSKRRKKSAFPKAPQGQSSGQNRPLGIRLSTCASQRCGVIPGAASSWKRRHL